MYKKLLVLFIVFFSFCFISPVYAKRKTKSASPVEVHIQMPVKPVTIQGYAKLDDFYIGEYHDKKYTHYCISIEKKNWDFYGWGYIPRLSPGGKLLYEHLRDGKYHEVKLDIAYGILSESGYFFTITYVYNVSSKGWNHLYNAKKHK